MKTLFNVSIVALLIIAFSACNCKTETAKECDVAPASTVTLDANLKADDILKSSQVVEINQKEILITHIMNNSKLNCYDMHTGKQINEIPIPATNTSPILLNGFYYHSPDSIFLLYSNTYKDGITDSSMLRMINDKGQIVRNYTLNHPMVASINNQNLDANNAIYPRSCNNNLIFNDNKLILLFSQLLSEDTEMNTNLPLMGMFDVYTEELKLCDDITLSSFNISDRADLKYDFPFNVCVNDKGNPSIKYINSNDIMEWDLQSNNTIHHTLENQNTDMSKKEELTANVDRDEKEGVYSQFYFDTFHNMYFSNIHYNNEIQTDAKGQFTVFDKDFKSTDNKNVDKYIHSLHFTKDHLIFVTPNENGNIEVSFNKIPSI